MIGKIKFGDITINVQHLCEESYKTLLKDTKLDVNKWKHTMERKNQHHKDVSSSKN